MGSQSILEVDKETRESKIRSINIAFPEELVCAGVGTTCVNTKLLRM